jgi:hypothetical protein
LVKFSIKSKCGVMPNDQSSGTRDQMT